MKGLVATALEPKHEAFIVHIAALNIDLSDKIHPLKKAQITHRKANKVPTKVASKYVSFIDVIPPKLTIKLLEHTRINNHAIELVNP